MTKATSGRQAQPPQREQPDLHAHAGALGAVRVAPLHGETTLSYLGRVASRYRLTAKELIGALVDVGRRPNLFTVRPDGEVVFNAEARAVVATFCRMPEEHLRRALPAWGREVPSSRLGSGPAAWVRTAATIPPTDPGCRACTARATQGREEARRYPLPHAWVCVKHQCWMLEAPVVDGATAGTGQLDVRHVQQVTTAQRRHVRLLRRSPHAGEHQMDPHPTTRLEPAPPPPTTPPEHHRHPRPHTPMPLHNSCRHKLVPANSQPLVMPRKVGTCKITSCRMK
ncbi:TniQ family protein [Streptomyces sp. GMY02]|uniref:TniQ family protein n=1 Tax=Streptomyces sp. GMY02 TaxID=1333528 RepID=UPI001C2C7C9F|nr:TniQ family protein [Streptomyces sp. GMY02]QXE38794.1 TniQ family protein [Streptomyces sp. GMY02]